VEVEDIDVLPVDIRMRRQRLDKFNLRISRRDDDSSLPVFRDGSLNDLRGVLSGRLAHRYRRRTNLNPRFSILHMAIIHTCCLQLRDFSRMSEIFPVTERTILTCSRETEQTNVNLLT